MALDYKFSQDQAADFICERNEARDDARKLRDALDNLLGFLDDNNAYDKFSEHPIVRNRYTQVHDDGDRAVRGV